MSDNKPGGRDRLPEDGEMVIFWVGGDECPTVGWYSTIGNHPVYNHVGSSGWTMPQRVVYWVPLPEARAAGVMKEALEKVLASYMNLLAAFDHGSILIDEARAALALAEGKK